MKSWVASGIVMIGIHNSRPVTKCIKAMYQPPSTNQRMFPQPDFSEEAPGRSATVLPNGQSANPASLNDWIPNGIVMMKIQFRTPAMR